jgi:hypothetical protein
MRISDRSKNVDLRCNLVGIEVSFDCKCELRAQMQHLPLCACAAVSQCAGRYAL